MKLYVFVSDGGDGSYYPRFTLDTKLVKHLEELHDHEILDYDNGFSDGDGFHYSCITVPEGSTAESLEIDLMESAYWFERYPVELYSQA